MTDRRMCPTAVAQAGVCLRGLAWTHPAQTG